MKHSLQVEHAANAVRKLWDTYGIQEPLRFLGFCLSLLPLPVIPQVGQVLDRHLSDKALEKDLEKIWNEIKALNEAVSKIANLEDAIAEIAKTIESNAKLIENGYEFIQKLAIYQKEFIVIADKGSYQEITKSLIVAENAHFIAESGSVNSIEGTTVNAERTVLRASEGSHNYVNQAIFKGLHNAVSMQGVTLQGNVMIKENSINAFGPGPAYINAIAPNPFLLQLICPKCSYSRLVDRRNFIGHESMECPSCKGIFGLETINNQFN